MNGPASASSASLAEGVPFGMTLTPLELRQHDTVVIVGPLDVAVAGSWRSVIVLSENSASCRPLPTGIPPAQSIDVIDVLSDLFILRGVPSHIRSDNGPEFLAKAVQPMDRRRRG
jgi:hypothetical protein